MVTLSASYGAHGGTVGRALAGRRQLPFVDRVIPTAAAARQLAPPPARFVFIDGKGSGDYTDFAGRAWIITAASANRRREDEPQ
jgi:hypothetical protein